MQSQELVPSTVTCVRPMSVVYTTVQRRRKGEIFYNNLKTSDDVSNDVSHPQPKCVLRRNYRKEVRLN